MILPTAGRGMSDGPFRYPHDFEWMPRLAVFRAGTGIYRLETPVATLRPLGRTLQVRVNRLRGNDQTGDGSISKPFRTVAKAWTLAPEAHDTIDIVVEASSLPPSRILWGTEGQCIDYLTHVSQPRNIILRVSDGGRLYIAACGMAQPPDHYNAPPVWTPRSGRPATDAVYSTPIDRQASPLALPYDLSASARAANDGRPLPSHRALNVAGVAVKPGAAFIDPEAEMLYFRPFDDRDMAADVFVTKGSAGPAKGYAFNVSVGIDAIFDKTVYFEKVSVIGGSGGIRGNNQSRVKSCVTVVMDDVEVFGQAENAIQSTGGYDLYIVGGAYGGAAADALNVHGAGDNNGAVEVMQTRIFVHGANVTAFCGLNGDGRNNAATLHEWCLGAYFDCSFANSDGRVVGFIENARGVLAGCTIGGSAAPDSSGFRTVASVSGAAVMDLYECSLQPQPPGPISPSIRAEPHARMRLHGTSKASLVSAGMKLALSENIVEENATSTLQPTAGSLRLYNRVVKRGGWTRLYVRGVWNNAAWSAALLCPLDGISVEGHDDQGRYVEVNIAILASLEPILKLTHAPLGVAPWTFNVKLDARNFPDLDSVTS